MLLPIRRLFTIFFFSSLILSLLWGQVSSFAQSPSPHRLIQQGVTQYQTGNYGEAIATWHQALAISQTEDPSPEKALVLENLARAYQQTGQVEESLPYWQRAIADYQQLNQSEQVGRLLTEQAQTYLQMGQHRQAIALLCGEDLPESEMSCQQGSALQIARQQDDPSGEAAALGSLGEAYRLSGNYDNAIQVLVQAIAIGPSPYQVSLLNSLGNVYFNQAQYWERLADSASVRKAQSKSAQFNAKATKNSAAAAQHYYDSQELAQRQSNSLGELQARLNLIRLQAQFRDLEFPDDEVSAALSLLKSLPPSPTRAIAAIELANLSAAGVTVSSPYDQCLGQRRLPDSQVKALFQQAATTAQTLQNSRLESFALGSLGHFYECRQDHNTAWQLTQQALWTSDQDLAAKDSLYLWQWQAGRLLQATGKTEAAIAAYERTYTTLEKIRSDLVIAKRDQQFDFRDIIEPLYRQLAQLRLEYYSLSSDHPPQQLTGAIRTIDALKLAELQNYLGNDCVLSALEATEPLPATIAQAPDAKILSQLDQVGPATAVFMPILLEDRTAIVVSLPDPQGRTSKLVWVEVDRATLEQEIQQLRGELQRFFDPSQAFLAPAQKLYDRLIRPFESELAATQTETLVFVLDGRLRSIPMAALHDGQQFLIEKYAVATTPSLTLTALRSPQLESKQVLALGVTESAVIEGETYAALPNVSREIAQVQANFPNSQQYLDEQFTRVTLQRELGQAPHAIVHIATHGQFGIIPEDTFLVTGNQEKLTITELEADIRRYHQSADPLELLVLSACQTADGDARTTLGLAGITVQAGVQSALASLWPISDQETERLVGQFYRSWRSGHSKAVALQEAQKAMIQRGLHPTWWSSLILIGNWR